MALFFGFYCWCCWCCFKESRIWFESSEFVKMFSFTFRKCFQPAKNILNSLLWNNFEILKFTPLDMLTVNYKSRTGPEPFVHRCFIKMLFWKIHNFFLKRLQKTASGKYANVRNVFCCEKIRENEVQIVVWSFHLIQR